MASHRSYPFPIELRTWIQGNSLPLYSVQVTAAPFAQFDWPLSQPAPPQVDLRTWTRSYNINLIGKDALPVGKITTDLTGGQVPPRAIDLNWTWSYSRNLIGKDQLPNGAISTALTVPRAEPAINLSTWLWNYNVNLVGLDKLPVGKITTALTEAQKPRPQIDLSWTAFYNRNLIGKDILPTGKRHFDTPAQLPYYDRASFVAFYNRNLIGKDAFPFRVTDWPLPTPPADGRSWIQSANLALTTAPVIFPFRQSDWPLGIAPQQPVQTFVASYNVNLIGQDQLPARMLDWRLPVQPATVSTWIQSVNLALLQQQQPFAQRDWPASAGTPQPDRSFAISFNPNLIGQDRLPVRVTDWTPPQPQPYFDRASFAGSYNKNLVGKDQLPVRNDWALPTPRALANTWIQSVNLALLLQQQPFGPFDWPLAAPTTQPDRSFTASFNRNLVGLDAFPTGRITTDLVAAYAISRPNAFGDQGVPQTIRGSGTPPPPPSDELHAIPFFATPGSMMGR